MLSLSSVSRRCAGFGLLLGACLAAHGAPPAAPTNVIYTSAPKQMIFEWDINIRRSTIMGLVGAGGLGLVFFRQMAMLNYGGVATVILAVLVLILAGELVSYYARKAII